MSRHHDDLYIHHISEACQKIIHRLRGETWTSFEANEEKQDGIIRQIEIVSEAASHISEAFRQNHPIIDWRGMKDFRNLLIYGYAEINLDRVWRMAQTHIPQLSRQLATLARESKEERE